MTDLPPLRYLSGADVTAAMPPLPERLELAEITLRGLAGDAELPPKIGVHPRPDGSFGHAMPAFLPGDDPTGAGDRVGMKWVLGFNGNNAVGLPAIHATLLLNDALTGVPVAILDAGPITAERTAAISGVAIRAWAPPTPGRAPQGRAHRGRRPGPEPRPGPRPRAAGRGARRVRPRPGARGGARRTRHVPARGSARRLPPRRRGRPWTAPTWS